MKTYFVYNTKTGVYYISFENDLKDRIVYFDSNKKYFYKHNSAKVYLTEQQTEQLNNFINR